MGQLQALALAGENDAVLAHHIAPAQSGEPDGAGLARAGNTVAPPVCDLVEIRAAARGRGPAEQQRRSRRRIHLMAMMHFHDLDIPGGIECAGDLAHQLGQKIDPEAHIGGEDDGGLPAGLGQRLASVLIDARGTDDMSLGRGSGEPGMGKARLGRREIEHRIGCGEDLLGIVPERQSQGFEPGEQPQILAQVGGAFFLAAARQAESRRARRKAQQQATHPPARAHHADPAVFHVAPVSSPSTACGRGLG